MGERKANLELLRIPAMLMIVSLHYLDKGGVLPDPAQALAARDIAAWLIEAFCVPAVNVYVLISAYFLIDRDYEPMRAVRLWLRVIFYSLGIGAVYCIAGGASGLPLPDKYTWLRFIMPVTQEHYWFITAYVLMVLAAPLMNKGLRALEERVYRRGLLILLAVTSLSVSLLPVRLPLDNKGYDALWFICLYMTGGYVRLHLMPRIKAGRSAGFGAAYAVLCLGIFGSMMAVRGLYMATGSLGDFIRRQYQYNSVLCLMASVSLLVAFAALDLSGFNDGLQRLTITAASASLGVYLIHEHELIRYLWPQVFRVKEGFGGPLFILHWILSVVAVYVIGMAVELIRIKLADTIGRNRGKQFLKGRN